MQRHHKTTTYFWFFGLPLLAYLCGSALSVALWQDRFAVSAVRQAAPFFDAYYKYETVEYGQEAGVRFLIVSASLMLSSLAQFIIGIFLAVKDGRDGPKNAQLSAHFLFSNAIGAVALIAFLFYPDVSLQNDGIAAAIFNRTDLKFLVIASLLAFVNNAAYALVRALAGMLFEIRQ